MRLARSVLALVIIGCVCFVGPKAVASGSSCDFVSGGLNNCRSTEQRPGRTPPSRPHNPGGSGGGGSHDSDRGTKNTGGGGSGGGSGGGESNCSTQKTAGGGQQTTCLDMPGSPGGGGGGGGAGPAPLAPPPVPTVTEHDFQNFTIPPSVPHSWPADWGVAHRRTAFWADSATRYIDLTLLGQAVTVRATPVSYQWDFGDGARKNMKTPGSKPRTLDRASLFHVYQRPAKVSVRVITTYTGEYRVGNGGWQDIPGTAAVASPGLPLTIYRYHKYLVSDDCKRNPAGPDCRPSMNR